MNRTFDRAFGRFLNSVTVMPVHCRNARRKEFVSLYPRMNAVSSVSIPIFPM